MASPGGSKGGSRGGSRSQSRSRHASKERGTRSPMQDLYDKVNKAFGNSQENSQRTEQEARHVDCDVCGRRHEEGQHDADMRFPPPPPHTGGPEPPPDNDGQDGQARARPRQNQDVGGGYLRDAMRGDPMGRLLLELTYKINELYADRQGDVPDVDRQPIDVQDIAGHYFDVAMQQRRIKRHVEQMQNHMENINLDTANMHMANNQLADRLGDMERWKREKALTSVYDNVMYVTQIKPPEVFGAERRLKTPADLTTAYKLFPRGKERFSGDKGSSFTVQEYLETLNEIQDYLKLSEDEFKSRMIASCTGKAHELLSQWKNKGYSVQQMYYNLYLNFNKQDNAESAHTKLEQFKAYKNKSSAEVESTIAQLGLRASQIVPHGEARNSVYDYICVSTYLKSLPDSVQAFVRAKYNDLATELKRQPTFSELSQLLDPHRYYLDSEIKRHGTNGKGKDKGHDVQTVNYVGKEDKTANNKDKFGKKPKEGWKPKKPHNSSDSDKSSPSKENNKEKTEKKGKFAKKSGKFKKSEKSDKDKSKHLMRVKICTMCGETGHLASEGCPNIRDDQGFVVLVTSTYGPCGICKKGRHHPERYCPERHIDKTS